MDAKDLKRWRSDVVSWAEETVHVQSPATGQVEPLRLAHHQRDFLREATRRGADGRFVHRTCVASWPRREGKSLCVSLLLARRMTCYAGQRLLILANSERQAQSNVFALLTDILQLSPKLAGLVPEEAFLTTKLTVPALDNVCECVPCNWRTVQGRPRTDALACDELHAAENARAFEFASNQLETTDSQALVSSQAGAPVESNAVWRLYQAREEPHVLFSYLTEHMLPWAAALGERERTTLLPVEWSYMHSNDWGATGATLFSPSDIERAMVGYRRPAERKEWEQLKWVLGAVPFTDIEQRRRRDGRISRPWAQIHRIGGGVDRAGVSRRGDQTVCCITARLTVEGGEPVFIVLFEDALPTGSETEVVDWFQRAHQVIGREPYPVYLESYNASDLVNRVRFARLEAPTTQRQQALFHRLHRLLAEGRLWLPTDAPQLKEQLVRFEYDCDRGGLPKFGTQSGHDDHVYALAWSVGAAAKGYRDLTGGEPEDRAVQAQRYAAHMEKVRTTLAGDYLRPPVVRAAM